MDKQQKTTKKTKSNPSQNPLDQLIVEDKQLELKLSWKKISPVYQKVLKDLSSSLKLKGFRKGKIPLAIAEKEIGQEKIINQVLQELIPEAYGSAIKELNHKPLTTPEFQAISINKDNDWIIKAYFSESPEIDLKNYKKIAKEAKKVAQEEIKKSEAENKKNKTSKKSKDDSAKKIENLTDNQKKDAILQAIIAKLVEKIKPTIPRLLLKQSAEREMDSFIKRLESLKIDLDTFLNSRQMTQEQLSSQIMISTLNQLQVEFLLKAIGEQEKLEISDQEVSSTIEATEDEKVKAQMKTDESYQSYLKQMLLKQKVLELIFDL